MMTHLQTGIADTVLPEQAALPVQVNIKRKYFFRGKKNKNEFLTGKKISLALLNKICLPGTHQQGLTKINSGFANSKRPFVVSFTNAHCFNLCHKDISFRSAILKSDIFFRDGKGLEILCKSVGIDPGVNMCGTDTIPMMLDMFKDSSLALLGTEDTYLSKAAEVLRERGNRIVLTKNGFEPLTQYVDWIEEIQPRVILLGMGMPKQELLSALLKEKLSYKCIIINGGAIIDQLGERMSRAPLWMRRNGFEWLYRLIQEPRRLFNRYVIGNITFLVRTYKAAGRVII
jgi:exopolysaccharide biosynthesis WecB/TagA/CpsF family protein